jgi:hypothetical protein
MNPNLAAVLKFLSYAGVIGGLAFIQYLKVVYPTYDGSLVVMGLTAAGTGLGIFNTLGSSKSPASPLNEDTK